MPSDTKRIALFTTFDAVSEAYSLNRIVKDQLQMLLDHDYNPIVIVAESFEAKGIYADKRITLKRIPLVAVHNEVKKDDSFDSDVDSIYHHLKEVLKEVDVVLTHDIIYQNAALKHNFAARKAAEEFPQVKWLHWIHSATSPVTLDSLREYFSDQYLDLVKKPFPNSFYIFFNHWSIPRVARNFGISEDLVRIVHHPSDLSAVFALSEDVARLARDIDLYSVDAICVYPIRLDRGKQVEMVLKTMACLKEFGKRVRVIIVDFHSTGGDKVTYRDELKALAIDWGLNSDELIWTSEYLDTWTLEVPNVDVMALFRLSNVFIMPSVSESYSLITQEAALNKCVVVLNFDFPPFRDIFGPNAIFRKYSSNVDSLSGLDGNTATSYGPNNISLEERAHHEKNYHMETAAQIASKLSSYKDLALATFLRKYRNLDYVFEAELEPLFSEEING